MLVIIWYRRFLSLFICASAVLALSTAVIAEGLEDTKEKKQDAGTLIFRFEGGLVTENAAEVLKVLNEHKAVTSRPTPAPIRNGQDLCRIFKTEINFPGTCSEHMVAVAADYDPKLVNSVKSFGKGEVKIPDVRFKKYTYTVRFDESSQTARAKLEEMRKNWSSYIGKEEHRGGYTILTLSGYQIRLDDVDSGKAHKILEDVQLSERKNVLAEFFSGRGDKVVYSNVLSVREYWSEKHKGKVKPGSEGYYAKELFKGSSFPYCRVQCNGNCPKLLMPDAPVEPHPDLVGAIVSEDGSKVTNSKLSHINPSSCCSQKDWSETFHGTYGAGIIASQRNNFGLVGVFPDAKIIPYPWVTPGQASENELELRKLLDRRATAPEPTIVVFASDWSFPSGLIRDGKLANPAHRLTHSVLNKAIIDGQLLWIVAAGQPKKPGDGMEDIDLSTPRGPVNLGDKSYVIVVTSCENCDSRENSAMVMKNVNYSSHGMVHIAAPGIGLPGLADSTSYTVGPGGTSTSTAFVAGVAAALMSCYPDSYSKPWQVKDRIQITADPFLRSEDASKLTAGIINPERALLDPRKAWLRKVGQEERKPVSVDAWCTGEITLLDAVTGDILAGENGDAIGHIQTNTIARIKAIEVNGLKQWVVYGKNGGAATEGRFYLKGPGTLGPVKGQQSGAKTLQPFVKTSAGVLSLADIEELILQPYQKGAAQCTQTPV